MTARQKAPTGLTLDQVSSKLKFEVTDLDEGIYGLESKVWGGACPWGRVRAVSGGGRAGGLANP